MVERVARVGVVVGVVGVVAIVGVAVNEYMDVAAAAAAKSSAAAAAVSRGEDGRVECTVGDRFLSFRGPFGFFFDVDVFANFLDCGGGDFDLGLPPP